MEQSTNKKYLFLMIDDTLVDSKQEKLHESTIEAFT